jgi:hypothetical protein
MLMMIVYAWESVTQVAIPLQDLCACRGVLLYQTPFFVGQGVGFVQDLIRHNDRP